GAPADKTTRVSEREAGSALRPRASDQWSAPRAVPKQAFTPRPAPSAATPADDPWAAPPPTTYPHGTTSDQQRQGREITLENDPWATISPPSTPSWPPREEPAKEQPPEEAAPVSEPAEPSAEPVEAEPMEAQAEEPWVPQPQPGDADGELAVEADPVAVEADAARYLGTRDPRAAAKALEAARYYVKEGHLDAASDLLLQLICTGFIYYLLLLIRRTLSVQLLIGVMVLVLIYFVAPSLHLPLTTLLLQALFAVALIALVVVFQPELRRALGQIVQLGPLHRLLAPGSEEELEGIVDELVRAALLISEAKHGAVIVLERGPGLQDYSETGVPVNGKL